MSLKQAFVTALTDVSATDKEGVGTVRFEGGKWYKWVKATGATVGVAGQLVGYGDDALTTVDVGQTAVGAGALVAAVVSGTASFQWVQTRGPLTVAAIQGTTPANGDALTLGTVGNPTLSTAVTDNLIGYAVNVTTKVISLQCP